MNKKKLKILSLLTVFTVFTVDSILPVSYSAYAARLDTSIYDYTNSIYQNGTNDTFIYDTNDSVITTKTGIKRIIPKVTGKYDKNYYPIPLENRVPDKETYELVKAENKELMDNVETAIANGTLTKHIAADGQFYGKISDDVLAVEKKVYINTTAKGAHSLAVYAPPGEIATVKLSEEGMKYAKKGQIKITVGQNYTNADDFAPNNNEQNRMPYLGKLFHITEHETKVGTPFGGMIYLEVDSAVPAGLHLEIEVSGAVDAPYYDLGRTTQEEWKVSKDAPGLFAEIRTPYLRFMIPSKFIRELDDIKDAVEFWDNVTALSSHVMGQENRNQPMTLIFDQYISAGIAYASVGSWTCNLPPDWATGALNYENLMQNGSWGLIHEINHHYQSRYSSYRDEWGLGDEFSEITNNTLNTISYILYTNIAASRTEDGTYDWNKVTDPYSSLKQQMYESVEYYPSRPNYGNFMFSSFAHEVGPLTLAKVIKSTYDGEIFNGIYIPPFDYKTESSNNVPFPNNDRYDDFAYRLCVAAGRDFTWYMKQHLKWPLKDETVQNIKKLGYEEHIPVQSVYAMGEVGRETGRPFTISAGGYTFDFDKSLVSPGKVTVVDISKPKYGILTKRKDGKYDYKITKDIPENEREEFILTVQVEADGIVQETQLNCTFIVNYNYSNVEKYAITKWDLDEALDDIKNKSPYATTTSNGMKIDTDDGNNLAKSTGYFTVEDAGEYEFQVFGDDNAAFYLHLEDGTQLSSFTPDYSNSAQMAYDQTSSTHFTFNLEPNKAYSYTLVANNKDGIGWGDVNIRKISSDSTWQSITNVYGKLEDIGKKTNTTFSPPTPEYVRPHPLGGSASVTLKDITVVSHPIGVIPNNDPASHKEGNPQNMIDGDISTYFHSSYTDGNRTPFPHEYVFDLGAIKTFNHLEIYTRISGDTVGVIGDYEIYVADELDGDNTNWQKIDDDYSRYQNSSAPKDLKITLPTTNARYIKVTALNNRDNYNLTILAEVNVMNRTIVNDLIAQDSSYIQYKGDWKKDVNGAFVNGGTYNSIDGSFSYAFEGSETNIYVTKDVEVEISIDGNGWKTYTLKGDLREPSLTLNMDTNEKHIVEIRAKGQELALNMLSTDGKFIKEDAPDRTQAPEIIGVDAVEIGIGQVDQFNKLENVIVIDDYDKDLVPTVTGTIEKPAPGTNKVSILTYTVTDKDGNKTTVNREITVTNQIPILVANSIVIKENEPINLLTDPRLTLSATDYEDKDLTSSIEVKELNGFNSDSPTIGTYNIIYTVQDSDKNIQEKTITITVKSNNIPIISGIDNITLISGQLFSPLDGVSVSDAEDDDTLTIKVIGSVDIYQIGEQKITYQVTDSDGNITAIDRIITVVYETETSANDTISKVIVPHTEIQLNQLIDTIKQYDSNAILVEMVEKSDYYLYTVKIVSIIDNNSFPSEYFIELKVSKSIQSEAGLPGLTPDNGNNGDQKPTPDNGDNGDQKPTPDNGNNGDQKPTPDNGDNGDQKPTPDNGDNGDQKPTPDNGDNGDQKPTPDNGNNGDQKPTPDNGDNGDQKPTPDNGDNGEQKPTPDNGNNGDQKPTPDNGNNGEQKPIPDNGDNGEQKPTPDNGNNGEQKPTPDNGNNGEQKPIPDNGNNGDQKPTPDNGNNGEQKPTPDNGDNGEQKPGELVQPITGYTNFIATLGISFIGLGALLSFKKKKS